VPAADNRNSARAPAGTGGLWLSVAPPCSGRLATYRGRRCIADAEAVAADIRTEEYSLGQPVAMIITARGMLVLTGLALFLAIGLEPAHPPRIRATLYRPVPGFFVVYSPW
jgi:hypothetical protein